jgi:hypothetical protein
MAYSTDGSDETGKSEAIKEEAANVSSTVKQQASVSGDQLQASGHQVVGVAKDQVAQLSGETQKQIHALLEQTQQEVSARATEQTDKAAANLRGVADELRALAEGRPREAARMVSYAHQGADRAAHYADRLESGGISGVVGDVSDFARRRPGTFLLGAVVAGFAVGRLVRGAQADSEPEDPSFVDSQRSSAMSPAIAPLAPRMDSLAVSPIDGGEGAA